MRGAALVAVVAGAGYATTFSGRVALGDAPESVSGVASLGILHAPGYPLYVLAARAFSEAVRLGSAAARVNAFSLVCAGAAAGLLFIAARRVGSDRWGAALGSLRGRQRGLALVLRHLCQA